MYEENPIGKKVNLLEDCGSYSRKMTDEVCEVVGIVPWSEELNDWCQHYIVRKPDGSEVEIREVDCVFSPNKEKPAARLQGLQRLLSVNEIGRKSAQWDRLLRAPALPEGTSCPACSVRTAREVPSDGAGRGSG